MAWHHERQFTQLWAVSDFRCYMRAKQEQEQVEIFRKQGEKLPAEFKALLADALSHNAMVICG